MPAIMKPTRLGTAIKHEVTRKGGRITISAYALFDFATPMQFMTDQALWTMVSEQMPAGSAFDKGQLKPTGEFFIVGNALAPTDKPIQGCHVVARLGDRQKKLAVFGDRFWRTTERGVVMTEAQPFDHMPIDLAHAFGGANFKGNIYGKGHAAKQVLEAGYDAPLPNVEDSSRLIKSPDDTVTPVHFGPLAPDDQKRMSYAGTYDQNWLKNVSPAKPDDFNPLFNMEAPDDQRWDSYFEGGEIYSVSGMSRGGTSVGGQLPSIKVRCFTHRKSDDTFTETCMVCDTIVLFPNVTKGVMIFRGCAEAADSMCDDIDAVLLGMEDKKDKPKDPSHYLHVYKLRSNPEEAQKYFNADFQLMPERDPAIVAARRKAQLEQAAEDRKVFMDNHNWFKRKVLEDQGIDPDLAPRSGLEVFNDLPLVPTPNADELDSGEFDLAQLMDDVNALEKAVKKKGDEELVKLELQRRAIVNSTPASLLPKHALKPVVSDDLVAQYSGEAVSEQMAADLTRMGDIFSDEDAIFAGLETDKDPELAATIREKVLAFNGSLFEESVDPEEVEKQVRIAVARALNQPEGDLLHDLKVSISDLNLEFPIDDEAAEGGTGSEAQLKKQLNDAFASLGDMTLGEMKSGDQSVNSNPDEMFPDSMPDKANVDVSASAAEMEKLNADLASTFPHLAKEGQEDDVLGSIIERAQDAGNKGPQPDPAMSVGDMVEEQKGKAMEMISKGEARLDESMALSRLTSPAAIFPVEDFVEGVSEQFGSRIRELIAEGHDFKGADLAGADLRGVDFSGQDLSGTFFEKANLAGANFTGCNLSKAVFTEANLTRAKLSSVNLTEANLNKVTMKEAVLDLARLSDGLVLEADLTATSLQGCTIDGLRLIECALDKADFSGATLTNCQIIKGSAKEIIMTRAKLDAVMVLCLPITGAIFRDAQVHRVAFAETDAKGSNFSGSRISNSGFMGKVDLSRASFANCVANELGFNMITLSETCFLRADVAGCLFQECDMRASDLRLASFKNSRLSKSNLMDCDLFGANFFGATLGFADMRRANLRNANLYYADLMDTKLGSADLTGANLGGTLMEQPSDG